MSEFYKRTVEDVTNMLTLAKQNEHEVIPITQVFYLPSEEEFSNTMENMKLLSIDEEFIKKLEDGERIIFKGTGDEKVVACTENETYEVKEGEISNSLVLCPDLLYLSSLKDLNHSEKVLKEHMVLGIHHNYLEFRITFPRLRKLRTVLEETTYYGPTEDEDTHKGYYLSELLDIVQCSRNELLTHLKEIKALNFEGKWRLLSLDYATTVFSYFISLMEKQKWKEIKKSESKKILNTMVPEIVIDHILQHYAVQHKEDEDLYDFKEVEVSQCFAEVLLKTAEGKFRYNEFLMAWEQCLHPIIKADLIHLKGLALIEKEDGLQNVIHLFPEYELPENVSERFRLLFKRKERWTFEEIMPYIEKLATKNLNVNTMLTKFARPSNVNGKRMYSARYAK